MRALLLGLLFMLLAVPVHGQVGNAGLCVVTRPLPYTPYVVETEATALAESKQYLDRSPAGTPTALVAGDLFLRIDGHPFTLFIRPTARHTELRLESRRLTETPEARAAARARAEAFVQQLIERLG